MDKRNILLITSGWFHPPLTGRFWLRYGLTVPEFQFMHLSSMEVLVGMDLEPFQGMVLYFHQKDISEQSLDVFTDFVSRGGGVLALHSVTASFREQSRFFEIIGGEFKEHGPVEKFEVTPVASEVEVFQGIAGFTVQDELYLHDHQADIEPHFSAAHQGKTVPIVWTHTYGEGRICYSSLGHRSAVFRVPQYRELLIHGLNWVTEETK